MTRPSPIRPLHLLVATCLALALPGAASAAEPEHGTRIVVDRVAAVVDDSVILHSDVMMRAAPMLADVQGIADPGERQRRRADLESRVLDEMVDEELMIKAAEQANIEIGQEEINLAVQEIQQQNNLTQEELEEALKMQGYTMSAYREDLARQMLRMRAANMLVRPRVNVSEDQIRARYQEMTRNTDAVSRVRLRHILLEVADGASEDELRAARDRAATIAQQVRAGASFEELAREHSDDAATRDQGGELGWIERGSLATEWEDIIFVMDEGDVRGPITGPRGLHVFYVEDREHDEHPAFEEAQEEIREQLFQQEMERQTKSWLENLRQGAHVEVKLDVN